MRLRAAFASACLLVTAISAFGRAVPDAAWKKGLLKNIQNEQEVYIPPKNFPAASGGTYTVHHFIIQTTDITYDVVPRKSVTELRLESGKFDFIVNGPIEYAIEKSTMYLRDANGRVVKFFIQKKIFNDKR